MRPDYESAVLRRPCDRSSCRERHRCRQLRGGDERGVERTVAGRRAREVAVDIAWIQDMDGRESPVGFANGSDEVRVARDDDRSGQDLARIAPWP